VTNGISSLSTALIGRLGTKAKKGDFLRPKNAPEIFVVTPEGLSRENLLSKIMEIYSAYTTGWESLMDVSSTHHALAGDAIAIGRTLVQLMPVEPEGLGLLALMLHCEVHMPKQIRFWLGEFWPKIQQISGDNRN
jgi:predicted RNA polymerase sigma factor